VSDIHQLYQDFYLTDLKQEVNDAKKQATHLRKEGHEKEAELEKLRKDNYLLRC
jgi:hypothetical protein